MAQATPQEMNRFVEAVDKFMANYAKLISPTTRTKVYASNDPALINDYESTKTQARILKVSIEGTVGAWNAAKKAWSSITGVTSTVIGDAIDEVRSWFGYDPGNMGAHPGGQASRYSVSPISSGTLGYLGAAPLAALPAAAWIAGIVSAAFLLNQAMQQVFIKIETASIMRDNPNLSRSQAVAAASKSVKMGPIFGTATLPLIAGAALAGWLLLSKRK